MQSKPKVIPGQIRLGRRIAVGDGHQLYIEEIGQPDGVPVLFLHGGPGSGCSEAQRKLFGGQRYRMVFVDQRGAGHSLPLGELSANTTPDLVADLERVREALGIDSWLLYGGSWGSLLALAYAQLYPERTRGLVLRGIFFGSREEIDRYVEAFVAWAERARPAVGQPLALAGQPLAALARRILGGDTEASRTWLDYERHLLGERPLDDVPSPRQLAKAAIQMHYLEHACFLRGGQLLAGVRGIRHLPCVIVHGLDDPVCPPAQAEQLHRAWPEATWLPIPGAGHGAFEPAIARACSKGLASLADPAHCA